MAYDLERYLNVRSAYGASWGPEGDRLAFLLDTTGVPQIWTVDGPQRWPIQRTTFEERITFVDWSPTREELAFGMDEGGNERTQLYRLDLADGRIHELTGMSDAKHRSGARRRNEPREGEAPAKHRWGGWDDDGDRFAFASNRRDESVFDVYVQDREARGDEATMIARGDGWLSLAGWSPDDRHLLVHEARASFDHDLHGVDLQAAGVDAGSGDGGTGGTGGGDGGLAELRQLTDHGTGHRYSSPEWGPDGDAIYLATDVDADTCYLARLDVETGELETVREGGEWNVDGVVVDEETGLLAYSRNVDGVTDLTVGELVGPTEIEERPAPDLPDGVAGGVDVAPSGECFAITATGRRDNTDVWVADVGDGDARRWTDAPTAGIPPETFRAPEVIRYESFDGREIPALFTLPGDADHSDLPVIVDVHGGPESQRRPSFSALQQYYLSRGYAVFEPNVRGSSGYGREYTHLDDVEKRMDSVADLAAAHDWLTDRPAVDPDRIAVKGGSYGGFMVLAAMTEYPDLWAAGVDIVGIANFVTFLENTGDWRRELREAEYGSLEDDRELLEEISPINDVDAIDAPLFVAHGANDPRVPVGEAEQIADAAREQGVPVELLVFEDEGHGFTKLENRIEAYTAIAEFLDEHV